MTKREETEKILKDLLKVDEKKNTYPYRDIDVARKHGKSRQYISNLRRRYIVPEKNID